MKYDCKNCEYGQLNKDRDKNKKKYCKKCTVDSKDIYGKPSHFKDKKIKHATAGYFLARNFKRCIFQFKAFYSLALKNIVESISIQI